MHPLLRSNGRLAAHLDPGGTYCLKEQVFIEPGYRTHGLIAAAMDHPLRLNEIGDRQGAHGSSVRHGPSAREAVGRIRMVTAPAARADSQPTIDDKQEGPADQAALNDPQGLKLRPRRASARKSAADPLVSSPLFRADAS
ncbi:MAG: hypothetical protein IPG63_17670 [Xanthomonadales bacterium]|nr:hypothetical protein [Xanthomonadales bacterium]